jgi:hypothetical protein
MISGIDASAVGALQEIPTRSRNRNVTFQIARATDEVRAQFEATGATSG